MRGAWSQGFDVLRACWPLPLDVLPLFPLLDGEMLVNFEILVSTLLTASARRLTEGVRRSAFVCPRPLFAPVPVPCFL